MSGRPANRTGTQQSLLSRTSNSRANRRRSRSRRPTAAAESIRAGLQHRRSWLTYPTTTAQETRRHDRFRTLWPAWPPFHDTAREPRLLIASHGTGSDRPRPRAEPTRVSPHQVHQTPPGLTQPSHSPLHPTFGSPFVESTSKPVIPPSFTLPAAYTVSNVPPLHSKMSSFSAETLLAIFYQFPRDILQEIAAAELYNRDWRWHINLRQWMMKDPDLPAPIRLSPKEERGWYLFFDVGNWRRERVRFFLLFHTSPGSICYLTQAKRHSLASLRSLSKL